MSNVPNLSGSETSWYFTKEQLSQTASKAHGMSMKIIEKQRRDGCKFIQSVGEMMKMPQLVIATAIVFFQRFYLYHSFKDFPFMDIGSCCLFLAGKVEDSPKKWQDIISRSYFYKHKQKISDKSKEWYTSKETLLLYERILLQTLSFDLTVDHPYVYLLTIIKDQYTSKEIECKQLAQNAWNFTNDSLRATTLCLQYRPEVIACAVIEKAAKKNNMALPTHDAKYNYWFHKYTANNVTKEHLKDISDQIEAYYVEMKLKVEAKNNNAAATAQAQKLTKV